MRRRNFLGLLAIAPVVALAACGDDTSSSSSNDTSATLPPAESTLPPVTDGGVAAYDHGTGADDVVLRIAYEGGFVPVDVAFQQLPTLLVTGDGQLLQQGPVPAIYPGPLLPNVQARSISEDGIQQLLALADEAGLLADVEYARDDMIADAPDTVVTITVDGTTYEHRAYALGLAPDGTETDPARAALAEFVAAATELANGPDSDVLGASAPYEAETYLVRSFPVGDLTGYDVEPTVLEWPADVPVRLADAAECAEIPVTAVGDLLADATQLTFFTDADVTYQVAVTPALPGARTC